MRPFNISKVHMITYGNEKFVKSKRRIFNEAINTGWFDTITLYGPEDLDEEFKLKFQNILKQPRIGGYGIWRPYIIKKKLNEINDNDILIYIDAGCSINPKGKKRFKEYIAMLNKNDVGVISFQMLYKERHWTTREIFNYFNVDIDSKLANTGQILDTVIIMKKNKNLINMNNIWFKTIYDNPLLFTDYYNKENQELYFRDNRHEQSIFSVIRKMNNPLLLKDETNKWVRESNKIIWSHDKPFRATRIRI